MKKQQTFLLPDDPKVVAEIERCEKIAKKNGFKASVWSIPDVDFDKRHPFKGAEYVTYLDYPDRLLSEPIKGKTWLHIWRAADAIIARCGDCDHVYIEQFLPGCFTIEMTTGS